MKKIKNINTLFNSYVHTVHDVLEARNCVVIFIHNIESHIKEEFLFKKKSQLYLFGVISKLVYYKLFSIHLYLKNLKGIYLKNIDMFTLEIAATEKLQTKITKEYFFAKREYNNFWRQSE